MFYHVGRLSWFARGMVVSWLMLALGQIGFSQSLDVESLSQELEEYNYFGRIPGSLVSICQAEACEDAVVGVDDYRDGMALTDRSQFRTGSLSKAVVAVLALQAVDDGLLSLEDTLGQYLPQYEKWSMVTVRQMLRMESGVPPYLFTSDAIFSVIVDVVRRENKSYAPEEILDNIKDKELDFEPGTRSVYNNSNYILIGLILEQVRGEPLGEILRKGIVEPLGLDGMLLDISGSDAPDLVKGFVGSHFTGLPDFVRFFVPWKLRRGTDIIEVSQSFPPSRLWAAGGVAARPRNMNQFMRAVIKAQLISPERLDEMQEFVVSNVLGATINYGLGLMEIPTTFGTFYGHGGVAVGYENMTYYSPETDIGITIAQNTGPTGTFSIFSDVLDKLFNGFNVKAFDPLTPPIPTVFASGLHFQAKGRIGAESLGGRRASGVGYGMERHLGRRQSYNFFAAGSFALNGREYVRVDAMSQASLIALVPSATTPVAFVAVDKELLREIAEQENAFMEIPANDPRLRDGSIFAMVGSAQNNPDGSLGETCVSRILDRGRPLVLKADVNLGENFESGDTLKFIANVPTRNRYNSDQNNLDLFGLKGC